MTPKRLLPAGLSLALLLFLTATGSAQAFGYLGAGATIPTGDYGDNANTGWLGAGGIGFPIGDDGLAAGVEAFYGQNNHDLDGDKTTPYGALGFVQFSFGDMEKLHPYLLGGAGLLVHKYSSDTFKGDSESRFAYSFGAGLAYPLGGTTGLYGEGRYWGSDGTAFFGILGGFYVSFGGK